MPLPTTGPLSVWEIANEFGVANQMSSFYSLADGIPASGLITIGHFRGKQFPTGQAVFTGNGTFTFTVPFGVKSISMVAVAAANNTPGYGAASVTVGGVIVCRAENGNRIGDGGGDGGVGPSYYRDGYGYYFGSGGGGAGGYAGNGGRGARYETSYAGPGQGGGGGGGGHGPSGGYGAGGGGVGLLGQGANGAAGSGGGSGGAPGQGYNYSTYSYGGNYGGGVGGGPTGSGIQGGALSYKNNVAVTPGQAVTVVIGYGYLGGASNNGAVRIIWGKNRAYPSTNTHDM